MERRGRERGDGAAVTKARELSRKVLGLQRRAAGADSDAETVGETIIEYMIEYVEYVCVLLYKYIYIYIYILCICMIILYHIIVYVSLLH